MKRMAIAMAFEYKYNSLENPDDWDYGMLISLKELVGFHHNSKVNPILMDVIYCKKNGLQYTGKHKYAQRSSRAIIRELDGIEAQIVADSIEDGHSIRQSLSVLNNHEKEKGSNLEYSVSSVYS